MNPTCKTCRWWAESEKRQGVGDCHRYPPVPSVDGEGDSYTHFPFVDHDDFCGEHQPVERLIEGATRTVLD